VTRHQRRLPVRSSPRLYGLDGTGCLGLCPELRTPPTRGRRRTSGWGQAIEHGPETTPSTSAEPPISSTCDLVSQLLPRLLWVLRHAPAATADGAPAPNPKELGGHRRDVHSYTGRQGRRPAVPRRHRRGLPQHSPRPRPPDRKTSRRDDPERQTGSSASTAHSRQFRGCCPVSGLQPLVSVPYAFLPCYRTRPAGGGPLLDCRGPLATQRRTSGVGAALQLHPTVTAAWGGVSHPTRLYGASWRSAATDDMRLSRCGGKGAASGRARSFQTSSLGGSNLGTHAAGSSPKRKCLGRP
jgi:hypothetical protein